MKRVSGQLTQTEVEAIRAATSPSTSNPFVTESEVAGFGQVTTTYAALSAAALAGTLTAGQKYSFPFQTKQRMIDSDGNEIMALDDAPAPGNITITPDAVGANPVTYYYRLLYFGDGGRSLPSTEIEITQGDSTTELILTFDEIPSSFNYVFVFRGSEANVYTERNITDIITSPVDILGDFEPSDYDGFLSNFSVKQTPGTNPIIVTGTTETLIVTATSANTLDPRACSVEYPNDIIEYDWNPANWEHISAFYNSDTSEIVAGWKGVIVSRNNGKHNFDSKNLTYRLWNIAQPTWNEIIEFTAGEFVCNGEVPALYVALDTSTDVEPGVDEGWETYWKLLYSGLLGWFQSWSPVEWAINVDGEQYNLPIIDNTDFVDVKYEQDDQCFNNWHERSIQDIPYITCGNGSYNNKFCANSSPVNKWIALPDYSAYNEFKYSIAPTFLNCPGVCTMKHESGLSGQYQTYIDDSGDNPTFVIAENSVSCSVGN